MKKLQALNKRTAPKSVMPEKIIQFGEGNFLRAFVDWIIYNMIRRPTSTVQWLLFSLSRRVWLTG